MLSDLTQIGKAHGAPGKDLRGPHSGELEAGRLYVACGMWKRSNPSRAMEMTADEKKVDSRYMFLSQKPVLYV